MDNTYKSKEQHRDHIGLKKVEPHINCQYPKNKCNNL